MTKSPYEYIAEPIKAWCEENYYTDFIVTIRVGDHETTEYLGLTNDGCNFVWENDWWEGEEDVRLVGFAALDDIRIQNYPALTNYHLIVSKTPYELADWIAQILTYHNVKMYVKCERSCPLYKCCNDGPDNIEAWLNAPAEVHI